MQTDRETGASGWAIRSMLLALAALLPALVVEMLFEGDVGFFGAVLAIALLGAAASLIGLLQAPIVASAIRVGRAIPPASLAALAISLAIVVPVVALLGTAWSKALARVTIPSVHSWLMAAGLILVAGGAVMAAWAARIIVDSLHPAWTAGRAWALMAFLGIGALGFVVLVSGSIRYYVPSAVWLSTACVFGVGEILILAVMGLIGRAPRTTHSPGLAITLGLMPIALLAVAHGWAKAFPQAGREVLDISGASSKILWSLRRVTDRDGDGTSGWFGEGDCDDSNPSVHPFALDLPGNGVDEDCDGLDATKGEPGWWRVASPFARSPADGKVLNVVFICVDAVRADHVSFAGYPRQTTPNIDRLARRSWYFEQAIAPSATTRETIPALLTGRYPSGISWNKTKPIWQIDEAQPILTEVLQKAGFRTIAIVDEWLDRFLPSFKRGFDVFEVPYGSGKWLQFGQVAAPYITFAAIREIEKTPSTRPFFLYAQFEAAHHPYVVHEGFPSFGTKDIDRYDGEIAYVDHYVGILLDYLTTTRRLDRTMVVIFADHGEEFGEHGAFQHSLALHAESIHVPLLVYVPGQRPARVQERVSLVDVAPTVLDTLGYRPENMEFQGMSLWFHVSPRPVAPADRDIFSELMVIVREPPRFRKAIYWGDYKLLWDMTDDQMLLYDVRRDPNEKQPLHDEGVQSALFERLRAFVGAGTHRPAD